MIDYIHLASIYLLNILPGGIDTVLQPGLHRFVLQQSKYSTYLITVLLPLNFNILVEDVDAVSQSKVHRSVLQQRKHDT